MTVPTPPPRSSTTGPAERSRKLPLRLVLIVPFILQLLVVVALIGGLSLRYGRQAVDEVTAQLHVELTGRIREFVRGFLAAPHRINELNADAIALGELEVRDPRALGRHFYRQLTKSEHLDFIFFGTPHGGVASAGRRQDGTLVVAATDFDPDRGLVSGTYHEYTADPGGNRRDLFEASPGFDSRRRPWFRAAEEAEQAVWSPIFRLFVEGSLALAASWPVYDGEAPDRRGELQGVLGVDLRLTGIGEFLRRLEIGKTGHSFIIERSGLLVAASSAESPLMRDGGGEPRRRRAEESEEPLIATTARFLSRHFGDPHRERLGEIREDRQLTYEHDGERRFVQVAPLRDPWGIDWLIVTVVPEADFMAPIEASKRRTMWLCLGAFAAATLLGFQTSRWIARPILRLSEASRSIAAGRLDQRVEVGGVGELSDLAQSFNRMATQLEGAFDELEIRVEERTAELHEAKEAAVRASRAKSRFLANISHEIRTPLAAVLGYADLLLAAPRRTDEEAELYLSSIRHQGSHLDQLLRDLLDLSRIEAGRLELDPQPCELAELLAQLASVFAPLARESGLALSIETPACLPWRFVADAGRVRQILSNLLSNAIKYTDRGRVTLKVESDRQRSQEATLGFVVEDTGVGISEEDQACLFRRFTRLEPVGGTRPHGFGLGLAITRQLAELMGGRVSVRSRQGHGSRFRVVIPIRDCDDWARRNWFSVQSSHSVFLPELERLSGRVLIAEDSRSLQLLCKRMLERWGLRCTTADDGLEAVERARRRPFDVILMDWQMPEMDGLEATRKLRRMGIDTPIVALTAAAMFGDRERCLRAGCDRYLVKPIDFKELHRLLGKLLGQLENTGMIATVTPPALAAEAPAITGLSGGGLVTGKDEELAALVHAFVHRLPEKIADLESALAASDWNTLDAAVHKLVGTAGTYGLSEIFHAAEALETVTREQDGAGARRALDRLTAAVRGAASTDSEFSTIQPGR